MSARSTGGLCGKARRQRERSRAARLYAKQLVDEYLDPAWTEPRPKRCVPIGRRSEFLPSVVSPPAPGRFSTEGESFVNASAGQLEWPFRDGDRQKDESLSFGADASMRPEETPAVLLVKRPQPRRDRPTTISRPSRSQSAFTFGGFILGCAMGSAAAVMMLMVAQAVAR